MAHLANRCCSAASEPGTRPHVPQCTDCAASHARSSSLASAARFEWRKPSASRLASAASCRFCSSSRLVNSFVVKPSCPRLVLDAFASAWLTRSPSAASVRPPFFLRSLSSGSSASRNRCAPSSAERFCRTVSLARQTRRRAARLFCDSRSTNVQTQSAAAAGTEAAAEDGRVVSALGAAMSAMSAGRASLAGGGKRTYDIDVSYGPWL